MTPRPALHLPLNGSLAGTAANVAVTATGNGALRYRDADLGGRQCALVEVGGTNRVLNPYGAGTAASTYGVSSNNSIGTDSALDMPVDRVPSGGSWITSTLVSSSLIQVDSPIFASRPSASVGQTWALQVWLYHEAGSNQTFTVQIRQYQGSSILAGLGGDHVVPTHTPTLIELVATLDQAATETVMARVFLTGLSKIWQFGAQLEQSDHVTSLIPEFDNAGSLGTGYAWSGTPHASTSTRALTTIEADYDSTIEHIFCRYSEDFGATWATASLTSATTFGSYASFDLTANVLTIESSRALMVRDVAVYDVPLSAGEEAAVIAAIEAGDSLDFGKPFPGVFHHFGRIAGKHWPAIVTVNGSY